MSSTPETPQPVVGRRLFFLLLCLFGYVLVIGGWWLARRADRNAPPREPVAILVLHFTNSDGIAPELSKELSKIEAIRIVRDDSSAPANEQEIRDLARKWKANAVVSGNVVRHGERFQITAQLIDTESGYHVWSHTYEARTIDPPRIAGEIAGGITSALKGER